jgi:glycosyltransferase involved in cell wall biosynthesis
MAALSQPVRRVTPLVSILIPCHNAAPWLAQTLESALAQTWPHREIIVVDDGSNDGSDGIARTYAGHGVHLVTQENRGAAAARNRAVGEAHGEFFQFLDADDLISPDKISAQMALLPTRPAGTVASCAWGRFTDDPATARFIDEPVFRDFSPVDFLMLSARAGAMVHPSSWLVPRTVAERAGPWDESLTLNDDGEYFCRVLLASAGMAFTPGARSYYRSGLPGSLSQRRDERSRRSQFRSIELIAHYLITAENSQRTRRACANYYQRFLHDFFPVPRELMRTAAARVAALGGADLGPPAMGPRTAVLARFIGWKNARRLKHWLRRT